MRERLVGAPVATSALVDPSGAPPALPLPTAWIAPGVVPEVVSGRVSGAVPLVVAGLVAVATALWLWPRSGRRLHGGVMRHVLAPGARGTEPSGPQISGDAETEVATHAMAMANDHSHLPFWRGGRRRRPRPMARGPTSDEVAGGMVLLAVALQSGCGVVEAIESAAAVAPGRAGHELAVVAAALRWGVADNQAWGAVSPRWRRTSIALRLAAASGVAPSTLLLSGAEDLRAARLAGVEVAAARLGVRLVGPLGLAFLPAFVLTTVLPVVVAIASQVLAA